MTRKKYFYLARMMRPENIRFSLLLLIASALITGASALSVVSASVLYILLYGTAAVLNDLNDIAVDKANKRDRPLAVNGLSERDAKRFLGVLIAILIVLLIASREALSLVFVLLFSLISWLYSSPPIQLSRRGLLGTAMLSIGYIVLPLWYGLALGDIAFDNEAITLLIAGGLYAAAPLLFTDIKDEPGDKKHEKRTPLVRYGFTLIRRIASDLVITGAAILLYFFDFQIMLIVSLGLYWIIARMPYRADIRGRLFVYFVLMAAQLIYYVSLL